MCSLAVLCVILLGCTSHAQDTSAVAKPGAKSPPKKKIHQTVQNRIDAAHLSAKRSVELINTLKSKVRDCRISADTAGEQDAMKSLNREIASLRLIISEATKLPPINFRDMDKGDSGSITSTVEVIQVVSKQMGSCLAAISRDRPVLVMIRGLNLENVVDGKKLKLDQSLFEVQGTVTYETVGMGSKTVHELLCIFDQSELPTGEFSQYEIDATIPDLTPDEKKKRQIALDAIAARKKKEDDTKANEEKKAKMEMDEKKAAAKLALAKKFIDKKETETGRKWLKELIESYPGTAAATEAEQILSKP